MAGLAVMTLPDAGSRFDATPEQALDAIAGHDGPIVVDFDETLLLGNSTALFLDSVRPRLLAYLLIKVIDVLRTRRGPRGADADTARLRAVLRFMPWSRWMWARRASRVIEERLNRPLVAALERGGGSVVVSTKGFRPVIEPLLVHAGLGRWGLVAMDLRSEVDRDEAKLRLTEEAVAPDSLGEVLVVTDSLADERLLEASGCPLRVLWPVGDRVVPFASTYVPGRYLNVKRPNSRYLRMIVREDLALWILGSVWLVDNPIPHVLGLVVLALSFWAIYEYGYLDNDRVADRHESDPTLSDLYHQRQLEIPAWKPVAVAVTVGVVGLWLLRWPESPEPLDYLRWAGLLVLTGGVFGLYNRLDKQTRVLLYPVLQLLRLGAFLALVPTTAITDLALVAMALLRWVRYFVYRVTGGPWPRYDLSLIRLIVFGAGSILLALQHEWGDLVEPTTISLFVLFVYLARHAIPRATGLAHRIDKGGQQEVVTTARAFGGSDPGRSGRDGSSHTGSNPAENGR